MRPMSAAAVLAMLLPLPLAADEIVSFSFTGARHALNPDFRSDVTRYSLILDAATAGVDGRVGSDAGGDGGNGAEAGDDVASTDSVVGRDGTLALTVETRDGAPVLVDGVGHAAGVPIPLPDAAPGDRVRIAATDGDAREVLLLPPDFPDVRTRVLTAAASDEPLYLTLVDPPRFHVVKLDNHGVPHFHLEDEREVFDFRRHPTSGEHSYARRTGTLNDWGRDDTERVVLDADLVEVERLVTTGLSHTGHHEFEVLPDGRVLMMAYDGRRADLTAHGLGSDAVVEDSVFQVLSRADGAVDFEWNTRDHVDFDEQTYPETDGEYAHMNAVVLDADGHYLVSLRGLSQILKVSSETGEVLWRLGGKRGDFRFVDDPLGGFCGQHFPQRLENGNLLIFDNGQNCWPPNAARGERTRVVEYALDAARGEARLVWSHERPDAYARRQGSAQRLANGNTLVGWGFGPDVIVSEVTPAGETVFELGAREDDDTPVHAYRVYRFPD